MPTQTHRDATVMPGKIIIKIIKIRKGTHKGMRKICFSMENYTYTYTNTSGKALWVQGMAKVTVSMYTAYI